MTKLKSNKDVKDFNQVTSDEWTSLKSCNMLNKFYPFTQGISFYMDQQLYVGLKNSLASEFVTAVVPTPFDRPASKPFSELCKTDYEKLHKLGLLWVCYPEASGNYLTDFPPKPVVIKAYAHGNSENLAEDGEDLGLTGDALREMSNALYEVEFEIEVDMVTGGTKILSCNGKKLCD